MYIKINMALQTSQLRLRVTSTPMVSAMSISFGLMGGGGDQMFEDVSSLASDPRHG